MDDAQGLQEPEPSAALFWAYKHRKARRRQRTHNRVREARMSLKRKGKGRGSLAGTCPAQMADQDFRPNFVGFGKGNGGSKSKFTTAGNGFDRDKNPSGRDGRRPRCRERDSERRLFKDCPRRRR